MVVRRVRALLDADDRLSRAGEAALAAALGAAPTRLRVRGGLLARLLTTRRRVGIALGPSWVLIHPELHRRARSGWDPRVLRLLVHEAAHALQYHELGVAGFLRRYLGDYLRARLRGLGHHDAYCAIRLEAEARAAAQRVDLR